MEIKMELTVTEVDKDITVLKHLQSWMGYVRKAENSSDEYKQDCTLIQGNGKYLRLINHHKKRIAKKNKSRARSKKGLQGISISNVKVSLPKDTNCQTGGRH
jgi:hypothetical protein